jgi:hypothetical protein
MLNIVVVDGHWASDVVAGGFIGWLTANLSNRLYPNSNYGFMIFVDGVSFHNSFLIGEILWDYFLGTGSSQLLYRPLRARNFTARS